MKAASITYHRADTLEAALALAARLDGRSKYMAGGQSLMPLMNLRLTLSEAVIDISAIAALRESKVIGEELFMGAGVTHAMIEDGKVEDPARGFLRQVAGGIAYRSIRNKGTIGGSLAHADPGADWPAALLALGGSALICGVQGVRTIPLSGFQLGLMQTCLAETDILQGVLLPRLSAGARWSYTKFCHKVGEFAHSIGAVVLDPALGLSRVVLGAGADKPALLPRVSSRLAAGMSLHDLAGSEFAALVQQDLAALTDHAPSSYAFHLHKTIITRGVAEALKK